LKFIKKIFLNHIILLFFYGKCDNKVGGEVASTDSGILRHFESHLLSSSSDSTISIISETLGIAGEMN
jgi:hypothetical protein